MIDARDTLLERMKVDLIGPESPDELISDRPTDRYLTGILFPPRTTISPEDDDEASDADDADAVHCAGWGEGSLGLSTELCWPVLRCRADRPGSKAAGSGRRGTLQARRCGGGR